MLEKCWPKKRGQSPLRESARKGRRKSAGHDTPGTSPKPVKEGAAEGGSVPSGVSLIGDRTGQSGPQCQETPDRPPWKSITGNSLLSGGDPDGVNILAFSALIVVF